MSDDWIEILPEPLDVARATAYVAGPQAGGIAVFLGASRQETNADGRELIALDYEAYGDMALSQMKDLAREARERWPVVRTALLHRTGRVELGNPSVIVAVATPHRVQAFEACRWIIDSLKERVAIWKQEIWADGTGTWKDP